MKRFLATALTVIGCVVLAGCYPPPPWGWSTPEPLVPTSVAAMPTPLPGLLVTVTATATPAWATREADEGTATVTVAAAPALPTQPPVPSMTAVTPTATPGDIGVRQGATSPLALRWTADTPARQRVGVGVPLGPLSRYDWEQGLPGWYVDWHVQVKPDLAGHVGFAQMVRIFGDGYRPDLGTIRAAAAANPGSLWLIGNEPDVAWQDNATPEQYAKTYALLYREIKQVDPAAQVAIGGVSVPTPLRIAYLDRILTAYQMSHGKEMPVDVWNVHAFILREEKGSWGVGIPPGMAADRGQLYTIEEHDDLTIFRQQIEGFRRWMAERGFRDKPLIVSEYGILMPEDYGFPPQQVARFMTATFDYFLTARDPQTGYRADDGRLVQAFCWYSAADTVYPTSNLFDPQTQSVTPLGRVFLTYVAGLR